MKVWSSLLAAFLSFFGWISSTFPAFSDVSCGGRDSYGECDISIDVPGRPGGPGGYVSRPPDGGGEPVCVKAGAVIPWVRMTGVIVTCC